MSNRTNYGSISLLVFILSLIAYPGINAADNDISDVEITNAIEYQMKKDEAVDPNYIDVATNNHVVTLSGNVTNILEKDRVEEIAENIKGVEAVVNEITVKPIVRSDAEIKKSVQRSIKRDNEIETFDIEGVRVEDGRVVLWGMVQSRAEKYLCEKAAKKVQGVKEVDNQITVRFQAERDDKEIEEDIEERLDYDVLVRDEFLEVKVKDGKVTISGNVCSLGEKNRAEELAWINGVRNVNVDAVVVDCNKYDELLRQRKKGEIHVNRPDAEIKEAVRNALSYDPDIVADNITISVKEGVVHLGGIVDNLQAKKEAKQDAENTVGVWKVNNVIKVRPKGGRSINEIANDLRDAIREDSYLEKHEILVTVHDHTAYLNGKVDSRFEKRHAVETAWGIEGITEVKDKIIVGSEWVGESDWEIETDIESELWWSPYVDSENVKVDVENGVATLTGTVDTWTERKKVAENAYEGGAKDVVNNLYILYGPESMQE